MSRHGSFASLDDWLVWLETLSPREIELGLTRIRDVLARLDLPRPRLVIHVAGTNGKGSTAAMLEALFVQAGHSVGCYTSPHVRRFNERMRLQGTELDDAAIVSAFNQVESARRDVVLTYFEFGTLAALTAFAHAEVDVQILEVGLGGRLDAVNAIDPDLAIITNVTLDHCDWLGPDVESIAREKAGVMRMNVPVVFGGSVVPQAIIDEAERRHALLLLAGRDFEGQIDRDIWHFQGRDHCLRDLAMPGLCGTFQVQNAAAVLAALEALHCDEILDPAAVSDTLANLRLAGRQQEIDGDRRFMLDVAHNPDAARVLADTLQARCTVGRLIAVFGVLADKDLKGMLDHLCPLVDQWIAVPAEHPRALSAAALAAQVANICQRPCHVAGTIAAGLQLAEEQCGAADRILVTGSFYTVGPALARLESQAAA